MASKQKQQSAIPHRAQSKKGKVPKYAYINHSGQINAGYYVTVCKQNVTNKWHYYYDETTREVQINQQEKSSQV